MPPSLKWGSRLMADDVPPEPSLRRRSLLGGLAVAPAAALGQTSPQPPPPSQSTVSNDPCQFLNPQERRTLSVLVDRIIPADELGPGATDVGVVIFLDRQLAGAWGAGAQLYRSGPFAAGLPQQGYQLPLTPAELFREGLAQLDAAASRLHGKDFADCAAGDQEAMMT